jgi:hypothetical protein
MSKQSPKDPKFRCNICKEYYHAPENSVHYQCPVHGYLCEKHILKPDSIIELFTKYTEYTGTHTKERHDIESIYLPKSLLDKCIVEDVRFRENPEKYSEWKDSMSKEEFLDMIVNPPSIEDYLCCKKVIKYIWNQQKETWEEVM